MLLRPAFVIVLILLQTFLPLGSSNVWAAEAERTQRDENPFQKKSTDIVDKTPYVPRSRDYGLEIGTMWETRTFYWMGGHVGFHLGKCWLLDTQSCQQYTDFVGGGGGQETDEFTLLMQGLRWQVVQYPSSWSPFGRLLVGYMKSEIRGDRRDNVVVVSGFGVTRYLNERMDFRVEGRFGVGHQPFSQVNVGLKIKIDKWVEFFAGKLKSLGEGTVNATGSLLEATGDVISKPFKKKKSKKAPTETKSSPPQESSGEKDQP